MSKQENTAEKSGRHLPAAALIALFFTAAAVVYQPIELFFSIQNDYTVGLIPVIIRLLPIAALTFTIVFLSCALTKGKAKEICCCIWTGLGLALYIESNFFSLRLHRLDGTPYNEQPLWIIIEIIVWALLIALPFIFRRLFYRLIYRAFIIVSSAILFMLTVSTVTQIIAAPYIRTVSDMQVAVTNKDIWKYSSSKNFIIILTDEYDLHCFENAMEQDPETINKFSGFTFYSNTIGMHSGTLEAVPYMFTAEDDEIKSRHYYNEDFFKALSDNGFKTDLYSSVSLFADKIYDKYSQNTDAVHLKPKDETAFFGLLMKFSAYKLMPSVLKKPFWMDTKDFENFITYDPDKDGLVKWDSDNTVFYKSLPDSIELTDEPCFKFIYLDGLHYPRILTSDLTSNEEGNNNAFDTAIGINKMLAEYLELLKKGGVYDNSDIIILADHGLRQKGEPTLPKAELGLTPLLLIKRAGESGELNVSKAPISHKDLYPTFMYLAGSKTDDETVFDIPEDQRRERYHTEAGSISENVDELDSY